MINSFIKKFLNIGLYPFSLYLRQIAGTFVLLFIARYLSIYDYGLFSSYKTITTVLLILTNMGFNEYILVSSKKIIKDVQIKIGFFILNALFIISFIMFILLFLNIEVKSVFILTLIRQFLDVVFFSITLPYFQVTNKFNVISYINIFYALITIIIAICCYIFKLTLIQFLIISIMLGLFNFYQVSYYAKINYIFSFKNINKIIKRIDKTIFDYISVNLLGYLYTQVPAIYVSLFILKEKASLYFAASTISNVIFLLIAAQAQKIIPDLMSADIKKVREIIRNNIILLSSVNFIILIFFIFIGKFLLKLIYANPYYINAYNILIILSLGNFAFAIMVIFGTYLTASNNQILKVNIQLQAVILSIILLCLLKKFGIYGASCTYLLTALYLMFGYIEKTIILIKKRRDRFA